MSYEARTKDDPGDVGRAADQQQSVDNEDEIYALVKTRYVELEIFSFKDATTMATGDGKGYLHIPPDLNGWNLSYVHARLKTAGTTSTCTIQVANLTDAVDMLSTKISVDSAETGSDTAATPAVIDTTKDDVATNDVLRIDVDTIHTTPAVGTIVTLGFLKAQ